VLPLISDHDGWIRHRSAHVVYTYLQEEASEHGLQRHAWWLIKLPGAPGVTAYVSPVFNAIWVASEPMHIFSPNSDSSSSDRFSSGHKILGMCPSLLRAARVATLFGHPEFRLCYQSCSPKQ
jgi:hypothetical protein